MKRVGRREFLTVTAGTALGLTACSPSTQEGTTGDLEQRQEQERTIRVIDFHQHTNYSGRSDEDLVAHQRKMGVDLTVLLPAGSRYGLAAEARGNDSVVALAGQYPDEYVYFANELPNIPETRQVLEKYLKMGARGIGEQKFGVACDSEEMQLVYSIAREFDVPVLIHFQHDVYNTGIERFHTMLEKFPEVNFIGHAQTWWGNIDLNHQQEVMYPEGTVTPGGITDRLLSDYPNMYGDLSANSGLNSMLRDEAHARSFLDRHQDKLLWASDCNDTAGEGENCIGSNGLAAVRRLAPNSEAIDKILHRNSARLLKIS